MSEPKRPLKVFLCHAHSDKQAVKTLYTRLTEDGVDVWLDKEKLLPGHDREYEIRRAVRESDVVVVCLSNQFSQAGFQQKEVRLALDTAMEKPEGEIFIIPARLEETENLESLRKWQWVDLFEDDGYEYLLRALRSRAHRIGAILQIQPKVEQQPHKVRIRVIAAIGAVAIIIAALIGFLPHFFSLATLPIATTTITLTPSPINTSTSSVPRKTLTPSKTPTFVLPPTIQNTRPSTHVQQDGEFGFCLARRFDVDPDQLLALNGLVDSETIYTGFTWNIPTSGSFPGNRSLRSHPATYIVQSQETVYSVACQYGDVDPMNIAAVNGLAAPYTLTAGATIRIP